MAKQFSIDQKSLFSLLNSMQPICGKRTTLDTTTAILFQVSHRELVLKSTDLEISMQASCHVEQSSLTDGESFLVPGKRIFDVVKEFDGLVTCSLKSNQLALQAGSVKLMLNIQDAQEFPPFPERIENLMHIETALLASMLEKVSFLIPQNSPNGALNGLFLEITDKEMKMTATDGHCLAQAKTTKYTLPQSKSWLIPRRAIFELKKIIDSMKEPLIFVGTCGNQLVFSGESFNFFTKVLADQFPAYESVLDKTEFLPAQIDRASFSKTLRRSTSLLSGQFLATQFEFEPNTVHVALTNKEVGTLDENVQVQGYEGAKIDMRFYAPYVLSGLQALPDEQVTFFLKNSTRPLIFESQSQDVAMTYLVMPVSVSSGN